MDFNKSHLRSVFILTALVACTHLALVEARGQKRGGKVSRAATRRATSAPAERDARAVRFVEEGLRHAEGGNWAEAIRAYRQALGVSPQDVEAHLSLGDAYMSSGSYEEAFDAYRQAVRVAPWSADAHYSLGAAYNDMAQYGDAFKHFVQAIRLDPDFAEAHYGIGYAYQKLDNFKEAVNYLRQAARLKPGYAEAHLSLGLSYLGLRNVRAAEEQLRILEGLDASLAKLLSREMQNAGGPAAAVAETTPTARANPDAQNRREGEARRESTLVDTLVAERSRPPSVPAKSRPPAGANSSSPRRAPSAGPDSLLAVELSFWDSVKNSTDPEEFAAYLRKYPNGQFVELARIRQRALLVNRGETPAPESANEPTRVEPETPREQASEPTSTQASSPPPSVQETPTPTTPPPAVATTTPAVVTQPDAAARPNAASEEKRPEKKPDDLGASATLEETLGWLRRNFANKFSYKYTTTEKGSNAPVTSEAQIDYEPLRLEGCQFEWRDARDTLSVSLSDLDPASVAVEPRGLPNTTFAADIWNLSITATGGRGAIRETKGDGTAAVNNYSGLDLQFNNKERADALARALQRAINLCGGKTEP